jgi:D-glycero-beta-D-manno-heptose-7-phosphate kinase
MKNLIEFVNEFPRYCIAVLGDLMLDSYTCGRATRISQEAPVPVVLVEHENNVPGGAANVARNVLSLRGQAAAFGLTGKDLAGEQLRQLLADGGVDTAPILASAQVPTTVKTRVLAGAQQVVRIDREEPRLVTDAMRQQVLSALEAYLSSTPCNALIMEDYAKGLFTHDFMQEAIAIAAHHGIFVTLDPHPTHAFDLPGIRLMTPNRSEAFVLAGMPYTRGIGKPLEDEPLLRVGEILLAKWNCELLLITLGAEGMALFTPEHHTPLHIPTRAQRVFDVSGAGDTVMATMSLALAAGAPPREAAEIANHAAGIVVGYVGTRAIESEELISTLQNL